MTPSSDAKSWIQEQSLARNLEEGEIDITLPAHPRKMGGLHPSTRTHREFQAIWADMGFQVYQSFDVEEDELNFTLLNLPPHHPARDMQDTFYTTNPKVLLRTHTSPGQIRAMRELGDGGSKPIRVISAGHVLSPRAGYRAQRNPVHSGGRAGHRPQHSHERSEGNDHRICQAHVQSPRKSSISRIILPFHRA